MDFLDGASAQHLVGHYGYGAIFVLVMMESVTGGHLVTDGATDIAS